MNTKRSKLITIILLFMTVGLMISIFYIGYVLTTGTPEKSSPIAPQKTKAKSTNYSKYLALETTGGSGNGNNSSTVPGSPTATPTTTPTPTVKKNPSPTLSVTPSPTETVLAYQNLTSTPTITLSATMVASVSATLTQARSLPQTGYIGNAIVLFGVSALVIFISFIF